MNNNIKKIIEKVKRIENLSIIFVLIIVVSMLVIYGILKYVDYSNKIKLETQDKANYISQLASRILIDPVWNYDLETVKSIISALSNDKEIKVIQVKNIDETVLYETNTCKKNFNNNLIFSEKKLIKNGNDEVGRNIEDQYMGTFRVGITSNYRQKNLLREFINTLFWIFIALVSASYSIKQILKQDKNSKYRISSILNNMADCVITIDENLIIKTCNLATEKVFGYTENELINKNLNLLFNVVNSDPIFKFSVIDLYTYANKELIGFKKDQSQIPIEFNLGEINMNNENIYILVIRDITERHEIDRVKNEFISTVSHELRTPLTSIKGSLELSLSGMFGYIPEKMQNILTIALNNSERLRNLIDDILDLNKITQGKFDFKFEQWSLASIIKETIKNNSPFAKQYEVYLQIKQPISEKIYITTDKARLIQVLTNLISNAIKFSNKNSDIDVYVEELEYTVKIFVQDYGIGIPKAFQEKLFSRFAQADSSNTRAKGGSGLGLSITKMLIERMNGKITYESEENKGTKFVIEFPKDLIN